MLILASDSFVHIDYFLTFAHQLGNRKTAVSMAQLIPAAHTLPRLANPAFEENATEANPATVVDPARSSARPMERRTNARSPEWRRIASCIWMAKSTPMPSSNGTDIRFIMFHDQPSTDMSSSSQMPATVTVARLRSTSRQLRKASQSDPITNARIGITTRGMSLMTKPDTVGPSRFQPDSQMPSPRSSCAKAG